MFKISFFHGRILDFFDSASGGIRRDDAHPLEPFLLVQHTDLREIVFGLYRHVVVSGNGRVPRTPNHAESKADGRRYFTQAECRNVDDGHMHNELRHCLSSYPSKGR